MGKRLVCIAHFFFAPVLLIGCGGQIVRPMPSSYTTEDLHRLAKADLDLAELGALEAKGVQGYYVGLGKTNHGQAVKVDVVIDVQNVVFSAYTASDGHVVSRIIRRR